MDLALDYLDAAHRLPAGLALPQTIDLKYLFDEHHHVFDPVNDW